jgi:hypothetical protein
VNGGGGGGAVKAINCGGSQDFFWPFSWGTVAFNP